jgi:signal transduction histidine kinase
MELNYAQFGYTAWWRKPVLDMNKVPEPQTAPVFRPRARIMKTLGEELISSDTVAVIELVKNSYDAGATAVLIRFTGPLIKGEGQIEVSDNGSGMDIETVRGAWMEPATPSKRVAKMVGNRRVLGEKGIGRFATSRLAKELDLFTRTAGEPNETHAYFDWSQFDDEDRYLDEIVILIEQRPAKEISPQGSAGKLKLQLLEPFDTYDCSHGTTLVMRPLTQTWARTHFEELQRGLSRLVSPFAGLGDFKIKIEAEGDFAEFSSEISPPEIINYPHYLIEGTVDSGGLCQLTLKITGTDEVLSISERLSRTSAGWVFIKPDKQLKESQRPLCGPISINLRVWDRDDLGNVVQKTGSTLSSVRHDLDALAGINIYRDNFRVMPYGEPKNDWLRLDLRRVQNPTTRISNNQVVGYIGITADANSALQDQSNREGIRENEAFTDLQGIVLAVLSRLETARRSSRRNSKNPPTNTFATAGGVFRPVSLGDLRAHLNATSPSDKTAVSLLDSAEENYATQIEDIKQVVARYQSLATLGKLMDVVLHDGRQPLSKIASEALLGKEELDDVAAGQQPDLTRLRKRFTSIGVQSEALKTVFRRIEPFAGRKRGRPKQLFLEDIIRDAFEVHDTQIKQLGIELSLPTTRTAVTVDPAEIQEIFLNLLSNSLFWLETVPRAERKIEVEVRRPREGTLEVLFSDTGPGVAEDLRGLIFDPYFSTKPSGVGLGLTIAGEIASDFYGGKLELLETPKVGGAQFKITLNKRV